YGMGFIASYMGTTTISLPDFRETGANVNGMWITNSAWVVKAILEGDGMSDAFGEGDYLTVTFKGYDKEGGVKESTFFLADYRSENPEEHYYVDSWRYWDLSSLGEVVKIDADMYSTKANAYGITTPCYFAFDDLGTVNGGSGICPSATVAPEVRVGISAGVAVISASVADFTVEAVSADGARVMASTVSGTVNLTLPAKGVNVLRVISADGVKTLKVMNR
ncbi:MAG: DUF4465 domain-containing protein, partial [Muribaculaceae bacterium]|nr:DUF4465 domain-containing protein [Muribaculaceae bacterium]